MRRTGTKGEKSGSEAGCSYSLFVRYKQRYSKRSTSQVLHICTSFLKGGLFLLFSRLVCTQSKLATLPHYTVTYPPKYIPQPSSFHKLSHLQGLIILICRSNLSPNSVRMAQNTVKEKYFLKTCPRCEKLESINGSALSIC